MNEFLEVRRPVNGSVESHPPSSGADLKPNGLPLPPIGGGFVVAGRPVEPEPLHPLVSDELVLIVALEGATGPG